MSYTFSENAPPGVLVRPHSDIVKGGGPLNTQNGEES